MSLSGYNSCHALPFVLFVALCHVWRNRHAVSFSGRLGHEIVLLSCVRDVALAGHALESRCKELQSLAAGVLVQHARDGLGEAYVAESRRDTFYEPSAC